MYTSQKKARPTPAKGRVLKDRKVSLYNSTRETLLQEGSGYTALVADALYKAGFQPGQQFTSNDAIIALKPFKTPPKVIRNGLYHSLFRRRGRRNMVFTMPEPNEARKAVSASNLKIRDTLPDLSLIHI